MKNDRRDRTLNVAAPGLPGATHLKIQVFFGAGGINYATYKTEPKGYWASVRPVTIEEGPVFTSERYMAFTTNPLAFKVFLQPTERYSAKVLDTLAAKVLANKDQIVASLMAGDTDRTATLLKVA